MQLRHINSYSAAFREQVLAVAKAVRGSYGDSYQESVTYLEGLARNDFYRNASTNAPVLRWHQIVAQAPGIADPVYQLHPSVIEALAPSVALRAAFGGRRDV